VAVVVGVGGSVRGRWGGCGRKVGGGGGVGGVMVNGQSSSTIIHRHTVISNDHQSHPPLHTTEAKESFRGGCRLLVVVTPAGGVTTAVIAAAFATKVTVVEPHCRVLAVLQATTGAYAVNCVIGYRPVRPGEGITIWSCLYRQVNMLLPSLPVWPLINRYRLHYIRAIISQ